MGMFRQRKPRQFNLKYRYYDEHKERLRESEARVKRSMGMECEDAKPGRLLRPGVFMEGLEENSRYNKNSKVKLGVIVGLLIVCAYIFLRS